jgi:hypothetical protein
MRKTLIAALLLFAIASFRNDNNNAFRYTLVMQAIQNDSSHIFAANEFISYKGFLIEFIWKEFSEEHMHQDSAKSTFREWKELLKVHFIDISTKTYFSVDAFSPGSKLIAQGPLKDKNLGMNVGERTSDDDARNYNLAFCKDTSFYGIEYLYYPYTIRDKNGQDSILCKALFLKDINVNLITSIDAQSYLQGKYPLAGMIAYTKDMKQGFAMYIKDKKAISKNEILTVEKILEKHIKKN